MAGQPVAVWGDLWKGSFLPSVFCTGAHRTVETEELCGNPSLWQDNDDFKSWYLKIG